jgi:hypothetical protein
VISLTTGDPDVDASAIALGEIHVTFPEAQGDLPSVTAVTVVGSDVNGYAALPESGAILVSDGLDIHVPKAGTYVVTMTISDAGDDPVDVVFDVVIPATVAFTISGSVQDGVSEAALSGTKTLVRLLWSPVPAIEIDTWQVTSDDGGTLGDFAFTDLVGLPAVFRVSVDGGTLP